MATTPTYKTMSLRECARFDFERGAREKLTGWGRVSKDRQERGISRKARRLKRQASGE
jgi:hypothetical protein